MAQEQRLSTIDRVPVVGSAASLMSANVSFCGYRDAVSSAQAFGHSGAKRNLENLAPWRLKKAKELMISLMAHGCSIEQVANACAISRSHFSRAFKNATGLAPHDWFRREQFRKAQSLLRARELSICCIAQECGFSDQSYFIRVFRQFSGTSPRRWQLQHCAPVSGVLSDASNE
ncbi:AraC family transcriptional regulator [Pseudomonas sp. efr-133-TYG-103a]|uniref:helix-turn-helix domain-containing protein n=1 Tax=Pseudomonas sp. efr-133-TYG-103a TaxID=3040308 RepID=UPI0025524AD1|nr:AraC family transcriptional regulator [Pseudomonas sp. efr-133-TYG-103a]